MPAPTPQDLDDSRPLPWTPGEGPFRIKGVAYRGHMSYVSEQVPGGINLYEIVRLWNYAKALDMVEFGKMRYNLLGNADHWFPGKNAAELKQHNLAPILNDYRYRDRIASILEESHALLFEEPKKRLSQSD